MISIFANREHNRFQNYLSGINAASVGSHLTIWLQEIDDLPPSRLRNRYVKTFQTTKCVHFMALGIFESLKEFFKRFFGFKSSTVFEKKACIDVLCQRIAEKTPSKKPAIKVVPLPNNTVNPTLDDDDDVFYDALTDIPEVNTTQQSTPVRHIKLSDGSDVQYHCSLIKVNDHSPSGKGALHNFIYILENRLPIDLKLPTTLNKLELIIQAYRDSAEGKGRSSRRALLTGTLYLTAGGINYRAEFKPHTKLVLEIV
jgi:hypothetical protein